MVDYSKTLIAHYNMIMCTPVVKRNMQGSASEVDPIASLEALNKEIQAEVEERKAEESDNGTSDGNAEGALLGASISDNEGEETDTENNGSDSDMHGVIGNSNENFGVSDDGSYEYEIVYESNSTGLLVLMLAFLMTAALISIIFGIERKEGKSEERNAKEHNTEERNA